MKLNNNWLILSALALLPLAGFAEEGLYLGSKSSPLPVQEVWNKTFSITKSKSMSTVEVGSAFLVDKRIRGEQVDLTFMTANHVIDESCVVGAPCSGLLAANIQLSSGWMAHSFLGRLKQSYDLFIYGYTSQVSNPQFDTFYVLRRSANPDIAIIAVAILAKDAQNLPEPVKLIKDCSSLKVGDPLYMTGFSLTSARSNENQKPIEDQNINTKRWSRGLYIGDTTERMGHYLASTTDAIAGSSGGPIVDQNGNVVSLVVEGFTAEKEKSAYVGNETPGHYNPSVYGVSCSYIQEFSKLQGN